MPTGLQETSTIIRTNPVGTCFAVEYFDEPLACFVKRLSSSWVMFDPFRYYWTPESEGNEAGVYVLDEGVEILSSGFDWLNSVVLLEKDTTKIERLRDIQIPDPSGRPDWALMYDFFLMNYSALFELSSLAVLPGLWIPDGSGGNSVVLCKDPSTLERVLTGTVITPILPAAVLRAWPREMLRYMTTGIGMTAKPPGST